MSTAELNAPLSHITFITESNAMKDVDEIFMREALALARRAAEIGDVPVGALVVCNGEIIGRGYNEREKRQCATAHAELIAIEEACAAKKSRRLYGCTLYVTMEPCPMCAGAIVNSLIERVVFGCKDAFAGCCGSVLNINSYPFNHSFSAEGGVLSDEAAKLLKDFFKSRR